jgi:two-component system sensor histidine kinase DesK
MSPACSVTVVLVTPKSQVRWLHAIMGALGLVPMLAPAGSITAALLKHRPLSPVVQPGIAVAAGVGGVYAWFWFRRARSGGLRLAVIASVLTFLAVLLPPVPSGILLLWALPVIMFGFALPVRPALLTHGVIALVAFAAMASRSWAHGDSAQVAFQGVSLLPIILIAGPAAVAVSELQHTNARLRLAQQEIGRLAVAEERSRFARDLHDLLGHTLTLMLVKLEVARRTPDLVTARRHISELERLTRSALDEVREVVGGYRQPTLDSELAGVHVALDAAAIRLTAEDTTGPLPADVEAALAWSLREAATNLIRHSGATTCRIRITSDERCASLTVEDNGRGAPPVFPESGLTTLRHRVHGAGGCIEAANRETGGFMLRVDVPLAQPEDVLK